MIRQATLQDFEAVKSIRQALGIDRTKLDNTNYRFSLQKNGFLLFSELDKSDFENDLKKTYFLYEVDNKVVAYLRMEKEQEMSTDSTATWFREDLKSVYFSSPHADIGGIAVMPNTIHKGIGTALLEAAENETIKQNIPYLFSLVVLSPLTNVPSLLFHEKHGFERVAVTNYPELFGLKNYQSILYGKKLI